MQITASQAAAIAETKDENNGVPAGAAQPTPTASELGLPWHLRRIGNHPRDNDEPFRELQRQHAAFIVRAANAHHGLVEACRAFIERFDSGRGLRADTDLVAGLIRAALKQAEV